MLNKGKEIVDDSDEVEIEDEIEGNVSKPDHPKVKLSDRELEEKLRKANEDIEREKKLEKENDVLERRKSLFPLWTMERLLREAIESPSTH